MRNAKRTLIFKHGIAFTICLLLAFVCEYWFSAYNSIANDFYLGMDQSVWKMVANAGLHDVFLFDHKGPYHQWINMLGMMISYDKVGMFVVNTFLLSVATFIVYNTARLFTTKLSVLCLTVLSFLFAYLWTNAAGDTIEEHSLIFQFLPLYLYLRFIKNRDKTTSFNYWSTLVCGICLGVVLLMRANNACINIAIMIGLGVEYSIDKRFMELLKHAGVCITGIVIAFAPVVICFGSKGMLDDVMFATFIYNISYNEGLLNVSTIWDEVFNITFFMLELAPLLVCSFLYDKKQHTKSRFCAIAFAALVIFAYHQTLMERYMMVFAPAFVVPCILMPKVTSKRWLCYSVAAMQIVVFAVVLYQPINAYKIETNVVANICPKSWYGNYGGFIAKLSGRYDRLMEIKKQCDELLSLIPAEDRDSIYIAGFVSPEIYGNSNIIPIGKYFYDQDSHCRRSKQAKNEIESFLRNNQPHWILLAKGNADFIEPYIQDYDTLYDCSTFGTILLKLK